MRRSDEWRAEKDSLGLDMLDGDSELIGGRHSAPVAASRAAAGSDEG